MKKLVFIITLLVLITACGKEEVPEPTVIVPSPVPEPAPLPEPVVIEPLPEPESVPDVEIQEPEPEPVPVVPERPSCNILKDQGFVFTRADVVQGKISAMDYDNLRVCYPYFGPNQADTESKCCII